MYGIVYQRFYFLIYGNDTLWPWTSTIHFALLLHRNDKKVPCDGKL